MHFMAVFTLAMTMTKTTSTMNFADTCVGGHFNTSLADSSLKIGFRHVPVQLWCPFLGSFAP